MTQLILNIEDPKILPTLKKFLETFKGISIVKTHESATQDISAINIADYEPNSCTLKAMEDARTGKTFRASSASDLISQILG